MTAAIIGKKVGMTSIYTRTGVHVPCTVVEAGPCPVVLKKTPETDGYSAVQLGFGEMKDKNVNMPRKGHFDKAGVKPTKVLKEFRDLNTDLNIGDEVTVENFAVGDKVHVIGKSKGKGFQGVMKRHGFGGVGMTTHGQSDRQRHPGSIGQSSYPSRVIKGVRMAGRMGGDRVTVRNLVIVDIIPDSNLILIKGSIPGTQNSYVEIVKK